LRSAALGVTPAFENNLSTNCAGVIVVGKAAVKRARCTNSKVKACLFASSVVPISLIDDHAVSNLLSVSRNSWRLIGTGAFGMSVILPTKLCKSCKQDIPSAEIRSKGNTPPKY